MVHRLFALSIAIALLAACGTAPAAPAPTAGAPAQGAISVEHTGGTLTLEQPAVRVVACAEEALDFMVALGVQPVGFCSDRSEGATSGQPYELPHFFPRERIGTPTFVGSAATPSAELIATLQPDLILSMDYTEGNAQLGQIAPTYVLSVDAPGYWRETLQDIGRLVGREGEAAQFLTEYDATVERLAAQAAPVAAASPNLLLVYSFGASEGTMLLGNDWTGSRPFTQLGFTVLEPEGVSFANGVAPISPETVAQAEADIIFVLRPELPDGSRPSYPIDDLLAARDDARVVYQVFPSTRGSTAPYTDRFVLEEVAGLLSPAASTETRLVRHAMGETLVPLRPQRVVTLDMGELDAALALGIKPVGSVTIFEDGAFPEYLKDKTAGIEVVGTIASPNLEKILALKPDLILSSKTRDEERYELLSQIAPTVFAERLGDAWLDNFRLFAEALGKQPEGEALIAAYKQRLAGLNAELSQAGPLPTVSMVRFVEGGQTRIYHAGSFIGTILAEGQFPRPPAQQLQDSVWTEHSKELIGDLDGDVIFYGIYGDPADSPEAAYLNDPLWQQLRAVQNQRVFKIVDDYWYTSIGLIAANLVVDDLYTYLAPDAAASGQAPPAP